MNDGHWIKLHRKLLDWEWWGNKNVVILFLYCLIKANFEDAKWQGMTIKRGSFVTGRKKLMIETRLTKSELETALKKLKTTGEIVTKTCNKYTVINVCNYDDYQTSKNDGRDINRYINVQQIGNKRAINVEQIDTSKKNKELKKNKEIKNICSSSDENINFYIENFGMINSFISQDIFEWEKSMSKEIVLEAMKKSLMQNKRNWNYVNGILNNWNNQNVKTLQDVQALETEHKKRGEQNARNTGNSKKNARTNTDRDYSHNFEYWERQPEPKFEPGEEPF